VTPVPPAPPPELELVAPGWSATLAYRLVPGLSTWRLVGPAGAVRFAKVDTAGAYPSLRAEAERMIWAAAYLPVPTVVTLEQFEGTAVLVTEALAGRDATDPCWRDDVAALVHAMGQGLRRFHEAVDDEWCPFRFDLDHALDHVERRVQTGVIAGNFHDIHADFTPATALARLQDTRPVGEDLVVCHGDYCAPNMLLEEGRVTGYVDLGELGVADRWWDVAVGAWSAGWNFGPEHEARFYEGYGIEPDPDRIGFFRLLYDLVS
jgi:kanamycin kinase